MALEQNQVLDDSNFRVKLKRKTFGARALAAAAALTCCWSMRPGKQKGRHTGHHTGELTEQAMGAMVWGNFVGLPMEIILGRLPLPLLVRCRSVCKNWNVLLSSQDFLDKIGHSHQIQKTQQESWLVSGIVTKSKVAFYVPSLKKWRITSLPLDMHSRDYVLVKAGMGGLVCLTKYSRNKRSCRMDVDIFVWNPLTNDCRKLPRTSRYSMGEAQGEDIRIGGICSVGGGIRIGGMYVNYTTKEYKVITVENFDHVNSTAAFVREIYDSSTKAWRICNQHIGHEAALMYEHENTNICCDSSLYFVSKKNFFQIGELQCIVAFEMETDLWREIKVQPIQDVERPSFVELNNKVYMVAGLNIWDDSLRMWQLLEHADGGGLWIEADRLPQELVVLIMRKTKVDIRLDQQGNFYRVWKRKNWSCTGSGDSLFFKILGTPEGFMYSISRRSWSCIPACDLEKKEIRKSYLRYHGVASSPGWIFS